MARLVQVNKTVHRSESEAHRQLGNILPASWIVTTNIARHNFEELRGKKGEVDSIVISPFGLFVLEFKNYSGVVTPYKNKPWVSARGNFAEEKENPLDQAEPNMFLVKDLLKLKLHDSQFDKLRFQWLIVLTHKDVKLDWSSSDFPVKLRSRVALVHEVKAKIHHIASTAKNSLNLDLVGRVLEVLAPAEPPSKIIASLPLNAFDARNGDEPRRHKVRDNRLNERRHPPLPKVDYLEKDQVVDGVVTAIDDYGAEVNLGRGCHGILQANDISWQYLSHPTDVLKVGRKVQVKIKQIDLERDEILLGMKQLTPDPRIRFPVGARVKARVIGIADASVTLDLGGSTGLLPASEMSWTNKHPSEIVSPGDEIEVRILKVGFVDRHVTLSLKRLLPNPWEDFAKNNPPGSNKCGVIRNKSKAGLLLDLGDGLVGLVNTRDLGWYRVKRQYKIGETLQARVLDVDVEDGGVSLGINQIQAELFAKLKVGAHVEGRVTKITTDGAVVDLGGIDGWLHLSDITWLQVARPINRLKVGQQVQAKIIKIARKKREISVGMKQLQDDPLLKLQVGSNVKARVTHIFDDGAFAVVNLGGIFGWLYSPELSWTKKNVHPKEIISLRQDIEVRVLQIARDTRYVYVSLKQATPNPWAKFAKNYPRGSVVYGVIQNKSASGLLIGLDDDLAGTMNVTELDWYCPAAQVIAECKISDEVRARMLDADVEMERISLGMLSTLSAERKRLWVLLRARARDLAKQEEARHRAYSLEFGGYWREQTSAVCRLSPGYTACTHRRSTLARER
jgi:ribosomal protein S1